MKAELKLSKLWDKVDKKYKFGWFEQWVAVTIYGNTEKPEIFASVVIQ